MTVSDVVRPGAETVRLERTQPTTAERIWTERPTAGLSNGLANPARMAAADGKGA